MGQDCGMNPVHIQAESLSSNSPPSHRVCFSRHALRALLRLPLREDSFVLWIVENCSCQAGLSQEVLGSNVVVCKRHTGVREATYGEIVDQHAITPTSV
jgi:hypothetical protein